MAFPPSHMRGAAGCIMCLHHMKTEKILFLIIIFAPSKSPGFPQNQFYAVHYYLRILGHFNHCF